MNRQLTYGEALEYLRNITPRDGVRPLYLAWGVQFFITVRDNEPVVVFREVTE